MSNQYSDNEQKQVLSLISTDIDDSSTPTVVSGTTATNTTN